MWKNNNCIIIEHVYRDEIKLLLFIIIMFPLHKRIRVVSRHQR